MTVKTYWAWETTTTLRLLGGARGAGAPTGGGGSVIVSPPAQLGLTVTILRHSGLGGGTRSTVCRSSNYKVKQTKMKKTKRRKHCALAVIRWNQKIS